MVKNLIINLLKEENGNEAVEMAVLFPVLLLIVGFVMDRFIQYQGTNDVSMAVNEAIRYAAVASNEKEAKEIIIDTLSERYRENKIGWCSGQSNKCVNWGDAISDAVISDNKAQFQDGSSNLLLIETDNGWCNGSVLTVGVKAHKSSLIPSYESFRQMFSNNGTIYHSHDYIISTRVESSELCK